MRFLTSFGMTKKVINKFKKEIKMKKILFAIAIVMTLGFTANAQSDGFFRNYDNGCNNRLGESLDIVNPAGHGSTENVETPLGSGLLVLTALGTGYAVARKKRS